MSLDQFTKTLQALENAETELANLHNTLDSLEIRNRADWHETQTVDSYVKSLNNMQKTIKVMMGKREQLLLENISATAAGVLTASSLEE